MTELGKKEAAYPKLMAKRSATDYLAAGPRWNQSLKLLSKAKLEEDSPEPEVFKPRGE